MDYPAHDDVFEEIAYDLAWGFVWMSFVTYPVTTFLFQEIWSNLSFYTALNVLICSWVVITLAVQTGRDFLKRKMKP